MVGIVLVSHSADLATAVKALAEQQTQGKSRIAAVGGTGDPEHPFGTDAMAILEAIQSVYSDDGVLVLMDLGSALMSTETAIEFMESDQATHVKMSQAPFVEGAMAAAVQASIGMDLAAVAREAAEALGPKQESIGGAPAEAAAPIAAPVTQAVEPGEAITAKVTLVNPAGLHFGPAVLFVQTAAKSKANITVRNLTTGAGPVDAKRFNQVLSLGAEHSHEIEIAVRGADAQATLDELLALARAGFGEKIAEIPSATMPVAQPSEAIEGRGRLTLRGIPASPGVAVGMAFSLADRLRVAAVEERRSLRGAEAELARYQAAMTQAASELADLAERMARELGPEQSRIFQAHALALQDPDLVAAVQQAITDQGLTAEAAVFDATEGQAARYEQMSGPRFQERAADVRDVRARMVRILSGVEEAAISLPDDAVIVAQDLAPSQTAMLDRSRVVAFCTERGGPTAHTAILARSMGIPAVVGLGAEAYAQIKPGTILAIDGSAGVVIIEPDAETVAAYRVRQAEQVAARRATYAAAQAPAMTKDGHRVEVVANLATAADAQAALEAGAEGVGLLRTEFLFQDRTEPPTEDEQYEAYRQVAEAMSPRPVIVRTLDIGGDKPSPYLRLPAEMNPFLGWRAIRISLAMSEFFKTQLRAILRAAVTGNVLVMFPMIAVRSEVEQARVLLAEAERELTQAGVPHAERVPTGIMVEVPAAAATPDLLAPVVDFFSIGTNDLTQYTFAADRGNARVAKIGDPLHPAVLRQISRVIEAAHAANRWVGLCGELAGQPEAIPVLLGLGLDEFSMGLASIPAAKGTLARWTLPAAQALARQALNLPDGAAVRAAVAEVMTKDG
jgi:phosphocarrier protein FPr